VLIQDGPEFNIPQQLNENFDQETAPQQESVADTEDEMPLDGIFRPRIRRMPPPVHPTLVRLGNTRKNAVRRPP
jgi:hypothetical protein